MRNRFPRNLFSLNKQCDVIGKLACSCQIISVYHVEAHLFKQIKFYGFCIYTFPSNNGYILYLAITGHQ